MLDIEFLNQPLVLDRHVVYRYRSGFLKNRMLRLLRTHALSTQHSINEISPALLRSQWLLPTIQVCDCQLSQADRSLEVILNVLGRPVGDAPVAIVAPADAQIFDVQYRDQLESYCSIVEELEVNDSTAEVLVSSLIRNSDLFADRPLADIYPFTAYFVEWVGVGTVSLEELMHEFEEVVLQHVSVTTGRFTPPLQMESDKRRALVHYRLVDLIHKPDIASVRGLVQQIGRRYRRGMRIRELVIALMLSSITILEDAKSGSLHLSHAIAWCAWLLARSDRLLDCDDPETSFDVEPDLFLVEADRLAVGFVDSIHADADDPLKAPWTDIAACSGSHWNVAVDASPQNALLRALWQKLWEIKPGIDWMRKLQTVVSSSAVRMRSRSHFVPETPLSFDEYVGNSDIIADLSDLLSRDEPVPAIILHGRADVGKAHIARIYGKIFLCENRHGTLSACGHCDPCKGYDHGGGFGHIDFDCNAPDPEGRALRLRKRIDDCPFAERLFVLVRNVERYPAVIDPLLKILECATDFMTFVFCIDDLRVMSDAGQSRCWIYRVRELSEGDARIVVAKLTDQAELDENALASILRYGTGCSDRLREASLRISAGGDISSDGVRVALGKDTSWAIGYLSKLLDPASSLNDVMSGTTPMTAEASIQAIINVQDQLRRMDSGADLDPSFDHGRMKELLNQFSSCAKARGLTYRELWAELAGVWAESDSAVPEELISLTRITRQFLIRDMDIA